MTKGATAMFQYDKHKVRSYLDVWFHRDTYRQLIAGYRAFFSNKMDGNGEQAREARCAAYAQLPNLLVYGAPGCGKHTLVSALLEDIYGADEVKTTEEVYVIKGATNPVPVQQSRYHIVIEATSTAVDHALVQEVVKDTARQTIVNAFDVHVPYRIIIINHAENLNYYAQTSLRCLMERHYKTCRFILVSNELGGIIDPIKSRCLNVRIPSPSDVEMFAFLFPRYLESKGDPAAAAERVGRAVRAAGGSIRKALWLLDIPDETMWRQKLDKMLERVMAPQALNVARTVRAVRDAINDITVCGVGYREISEHLIKAVVTHPGLSKKQRADFIEQAAEYDRRVFTGRRGIIHIEAMLLHLYGIVHGAAGVL